MTALVAEEALALAAGPAWWNEQLPSSASSSDEALYVRLRTATRAAADCVQSSDHTEPLSVPAALNTIRHTLSEVHSVLQQLPQAQMGDSTGSIGSVDSRSSSIDQAAQSSNASLLVQATLAQAAVSMFSVINTALLQAALPLQQDMDHWEKTRGTNLSLLYQAVLELPADLALVARKLVSHGVAWWTESLHSDWAIFRTESVRVAKRPTMALRRRVDERANGIHTAYRAHAVALGRLAAASAASTDPKHTLTTWVAHMVKTMHIVLDYLPSREPPLLDAKEGPGQDATSADDLLQSMQSLESKLLRYFEAIAMLRSRYGRPGLLQSYWLHAAVLGYVAHKSRNNVYARWDEIAQVSSDVWQTTYRFVVEYLYKPVVQMYEVIRYDRHELSLVQAHSVRADIESLERMLRQLRQTHWFNDSTDLPPSAQMSSTPSPGVGVSFVPQRDLDLLMREYEKELQQPFRSLFFGDLAKLLLIQVQKTKVDLELAMTALDKLLKANELNFTLITFIPSTFIAWVGVRQLYRFWAQRDALTAGEEPRVIRARLRNVDAILNRNSGGQEPPAAEQGFLMMEVHILRSCAAIFSGAEQNAFLADLAEIEALSLSIQQRLGVVHRMYRTYPRVLASKELAGLF